MRKKFSIFSLLILIFSCGTAQLTEGGKIVSYLTKQEAPSNCILISEVNLDGTFESGSSPSEVIILLRNKTAMVGGNLLVLDLIDKNYNDNIVYYEGNGRAYKCN